ncbi:hypothetical protein M408DRAFT_30810 [Serendipita vermifera MAFF 305830]|uniref:Uncharacterized protein n=1 Tax=Serendipita vermifera MAFF 305830 TaxID=933852 RepID=A0A0C2W047_SERVB|nr:hypothetical protein M408DRAFT_30810 [Serendipita vermifera MAFF 305830]
MIFYKVLFALLASSVILAAPIPNEDPSFTLEKRAKPGAVDPPPPPLMPIINQFPVIIPAAPPPAPVPAPAPAPAPAPLPAVPAPLPGPPRPIPTRRHTT